ncbi:hypothetical protein [Vitiosangium sp. GDMCC 1.1324]|uniref:hypothetical protein n=1 Tax=Vitiosangium sp. (strain GDMCC 1.1324) TaxID=2138576 RepID=UPI000D3AED85|nr:hypothetical protein [Vitiosangium sp. GDMCC 1.1324]PTL76110.1 hypothetical protein DAT35_50975 [Vitiosangium sp. GDMCC 1.1324]
MRGASQTQGAPVLNCPGCGTKVADGTAICPSCDYIIDASFISTDAPPDDESDAGSPPPRKQASPSRPVRNNPGARAGTGSRPAVRTASGTGSRPRTASSQARPAAPAPAVADEDATNIKSMDEIVRNAPQRSTGARASTTGSRPAARSGGSGSRPAAAPAPRRAPAEAELDPSDVNYVPTRDVSGSNTGTGQIVAPEQVIEDFRDFFGVLGRSDKIAFGGGIAILVSAFLPWKETAAEGDILGLMSLGLLAVMAAIGIIGSIAVRVRRLMPHLNVLIPWLAQLGLSVFCILWCIIFMKISYDATEVPSPMGNATIMNSSPSFGVFLGLMGALTSLGGTLLGLREKPAS